jgi:hypothetical protein
MSSLNWDSLIAEAGETANSFEPLPKGDYELKVIEAKATTTQTGKTMFKLTTEVQGGPHANRRVWDNLVISPENPKALNMFFMKAGVLGLTREYFKSNPTNAAIEAALMNRAFRGSVGTRTYNGNISNGIAQYHKDETATAASATPFAPPAAAPAAAPAPAPVAAAAPAPAPAVAPAPASPVSGEDSPF